MMPVIITADRETLDMVRRLINSNVDDKLFIYGSDKKLKNLQNVADQLQKQLSDTNMVCPLLRK